MRNLVVVFWMFVCTITSAAAQVSFGIEAPGISIGINMPVYPQLVQVPGYPVYYAPQANSNYFFYDGMYWVYQQDTWYASSWYNGPWALVSPEVVPYFILRVPVRYYRRPPAYFHGWTSNAAPRWGEHWGNTWAQNRQGWDNWDRNSVPAAAPLPTYQRQYSGNKYPRVEQQEALQNQNYRYQPHEAVVQKQYQTQRVQTAPAVAPNPAIAPNVRVEAPATKAQQQPVAGQRKAQQQREAATKQQTQQEQPASQQKAQQQQQQAATQQKAQRQQQQAATQQKPQQQQQQQTATQHKAQQQRVASQQNAQHQQQEQQQATPQQKAQQPPREKQAPEKAEQQGSEKGK
jgi:hypothetical protein